MTPLEIHFLEELYTFCCGGGGELKSLLHSKITGFILGCENWNRYDFKALLRL